MTNRSFLGASALALALVATSGSGVGAAGFKEPGGDGCAAIPTMQSIHTSLTRALKDALVGDNKGLSNEMWATIVDRDGIVCAVTFSGENRGAQWPGSRVISAQKANTGNAFSLDVDDGAGIALSSGNLYGTVQPGGSLFGLQHSNPVDPRVAYGDNQQVAGSDSTKPPAYGKQDDPMVGTYIGGVNVFGGGLALYDQDMQVVGGLGVSGDTSCTDHVVAWRIRDGLDLDSVPGGVGPAGIDNLNIVNKVKAGAFEHPDCGGGVAGVIDDLNTNFPTE